MNSDDITVSGHTFDPLLTGPEKVVGETVKCADVENLCRAIRKRIAGVRKTR